MIGLIDADSIIYIIGYNHRENMDDAHAVRQSTDDIVRCSLTLVNATSYIGALSPDKNFRYNIYKYAPYKGNRNGEKPEWFDRWMPVIKQRLIEKWNFVTLDGLEADDVICMLAEWCRAWDKPFVILSPDKDMKQIHGLHWDYKKAEGNPVLVTKEEAHYLFWLSVLTGDAVDNIKGVPGLGDKKAKALLDKVEPIMYKSTVLQAFCTYFGEYYGPIIFKETVDTLHLMCSAHSYWDTGTFGHSHVIDHITSTALFEFQGTSESVPDVFG